MLPLLLDPENQVDYVWADSIYSGQRFTNPLRLAGFENRIHEKGSRNYPLCAAAIERNSIRSQIRARIEQVFGYLPHQWKANFQEKFGFNEIVFSGD